LELRIILPCTVRAVPSLAERSSWLAVRILGSSHTNPVFVLVDGKSFRASCESARWCLAGVNQCWSQKVSKISKAELPDAKAAYDLPGAL
jgi:hypothetical protein